MTGLFDPGNPIFQSATLPLGLSVIGVFAIARWGRPRLAGAAVPIAFLAAYWAILGLPPLPPSGSLQKLAYVAAFGLALGIAAEAYAGKGQLRIVAIVLAAAATVAWLGWARLAGGAPLFDLARLAAVGVIGAYVLVRVDAARVGIDGTVNLLLLVFGLAAIAFLGATAALAQTSGALAAAIGGFLVWNWPTARHPATLPLTLAAGVAALSMTTQLVLFTQASGLALLLLLPIAHGDRFAAMVLQGKTPFHKAARPVAGALFGLLCVIAAAALAQYKATH